jgi:ATP-dependent RNA helicase DDX52/ROK1
LALPAELDFFKYAQGSKRKPLHTADPENGHATKRRRSTPDEDGGDDESDEEEEENPHAKQRVSSKGKDVPAPSTSFANMAERYGLSTLLQKNLIKSGYKHPTAIQCHGVPILLEASLEH